MMNQDKHLKQLGYAIFVALGYLFLFWIGQLAVDLFVRWGWIR